MNLEQTKTEVFRYLDLYNKKFQEIQLNQGVIAKNQELLATQNNKIVAALQELIKRIDEVPDEEMHTSNENNINNN